MPQFFLTCSCKVWADYRSRMYHCSVKNIHDCKHHLASKSLLKGKYLNFQDYSQDMQLSPLEMQMNLIFLQAQKWMCGNISHNIKMLRNDQYKKQHWIVDKHIGICYQKYEHHLDPQ